MIFTFGFIMGNLAASEILKRQNKGNRVKKTTLTLMTGGVLLALSTIDLSAASFNCHRASTSIERAICADRYLNELDGDMGRLYHEAKQYQTDLPKFQREWIRNRNKECGANTDCLYKWTENRIINFKDTINDARTGIPVNAPKKKHTKRGSVYFPEHGIVCDKKSGFCADQEGISMGFTKEYLGQAAQDKMMGYVERDNMELDSYTMSNGIHCESKERKCYNNKWKEKVDAHYTNNLYR
jgi:uncharacterized protein